MQAEVLGEAVNVPEVEPAAGPVARQHHHGWRGALASRDGVHELLPPLAD